MRKTLLCLGTLAMSLLLAGCITLNVSTDVKNNGSGNKILIVAMDDSILAMSQIAGTPTPGAGSKSGASASEDPFADLKSKASKVSGAKVEDYKDTVKKRTGVKVTMPFKSFDELVALSKNETMNGMDEIKIEKSGDTITLRARVLTSDVGSQFSSTPQAGAPKAGTPVAKPTATATLSPEMKQMSEALLKSIDFTYSVQPEGKILKYDPPGTLDMANNRITWTLDLLKESQEVMVQWQATSSSAGASAATATATKPAGASPTVAATGAPRTPTMVVAAGTPSATAATPTAASKTGGNARGLLSRIPCLSAFGVIGLAGGAFWLSRRKRDEDYL